MAAPSRTMPNSTNPPIATLSSLRSCGQNASERVTRSPTRNFFTLDPGSITVPVDSCPSTNGNGGLQNICPSISFVSVLLQIPQQSIRTGAS